MLDLSRRTPLGFAALVSLSMTTLCAAGPPPGDGPANCLALVIGTQTGTTVGFTDDSDEVCPYTGSTSPDVYYCFTPTTLAELSLDLCESGYDTKIYVYDSDLELYQDECLLFPGCNDDACSSSGGGAFRSFLSCLQFLPGETYYVVVDGWGGAAGPYTLVVGPADPLDCLLPFADCQVTCQGTQEGEPCAFGTTSPNDLFNGGCNCTDPAGCFQPLACGETICGESYHDGTFRDTDWYALDISALDSTSLTITGFSEFFGVIGRVDNAGGTLSCAEVTGFAESVEIVPCDPILLETAVVTGTELWIFVGADFGEVIIDCEGQTPCLLWGPEYSLTVTCNVGCPFDLDESGDVGFGDLLLILSDWGPCP